MLVSDSRLRILISLHILCHKSQPDLKRLAQLRNDLQDFIFNDISYKHVLDMVSERTLKKFQYKWRTTTDRQTHRQTDRQTCLFGVLFYWSHQGSGGGGGWGGEGMLTLADVHFHSSYKYRHLDYASTLYDRNQFSKSAERIQEVTDSINMVNVLNFSVDLFQ